jgi:Phage gp6-like head-tail connector protein
MTSPTTTYITLTEAKEQLSIDDGLTTHDARIELLIGAAIDWAENYTQRNLGELLELNSPADSEATPLPDPKDSPSWSKPEVWPIAGVIGVEGWQEWDEKTWRDFWRNNPILQDDAKPLRRDVRAAILLKIEQLFDRNVDNWVLLEQTAEQMLFPYRIGMGV